MYIVYVGVYARVFICAGKVWTGGNNCIHTRYKDSPGTETRSGWYKTRPDKRTGPQRIVARRKSPPRADATKWSAGCRSMSCCCLEEGEKF